jgi:hypothetical protein
VREPLKTINNIHFLCCFQASNSRIGSDFLFWYYFSQSLKEIFARDQYIPLLLSRKAGEKIELYRRWQAVSGHYERLIQTAVDQMPQSFTKKVQYDFLETILLQRQTAEPIRTCQQLPDEFKHWQ